IDYEGDYSDISIISITDLSGRLVPVEASFNNDAMYVHVQSKGVYFLKLKIEKELMVLRLVVE
ncbi:MAG: T9SS type A sorting domain-containing protein, partial [Flavobacteriales bacterium]|nr:T9SS type A sorting domain-containing protein [Flavobacteriales bacterium]